MANEGLFNATAQLGYQGASGLGQIGQGIESGADAFSQAIQNKQLLKLREKEKHQQLLGSMFGKFIDAGYIKPTPEMMADITKEFGMNKIDLTQPQTLADLAKNSGTQFGIKAIKTDTTGKVIDVEWNTPEEIDKAKADLEAKKAETERANKELALKEQEKEIKASELKAASIKQAGQGLPWFGLFPSAEKEKYNKLQSDFRNQLLAKSRPKYDQKTQKLQFNKTTGEYRIIDLKTGKPVQGAADGGE